jgi:hypothetical protein
LDIEKTKKINNNSIIKIKMMIQEIEFKQNILF